MGKYSFSVRADTYARVHRAAFRYGATMASLIDIMFIDIVGQRDNTASTKAAHRRARLREMGLCINGAAHGDATHGSLCEKCRLHRRGKETPQSWADRKP